MDNTRAPPGAPPAYTTVPLRFTNRSLRPVLLFTTVFGAVWSLAVAVSYIRKREERYNSSKVEIFYLVLGIVYFVVTSIEIYGFFACLRSSLALVKGYFMASFVGAFLVLAAEVMRLVIHYTLKTDLINSCLDEERTSLSNRVTQADIDAYCQSSWRNTSWINIGYLVLSMAIAFLFASLAASFYAQVRNPALTRERVTAFSAPSHAYGGGQVPLGAYPPYGAPAYTPNDLPTYDGPSTGYRPEKDGPFGDQFAPPAGAPPGHQQQSQGQWREGRESQETVTLEPQSTRRERDEGRV